MIAASQIETRFSILWHAMPSAAAAHSEGESLIPRRTTLAAIPPNVARVSHFDLMVQYQGYLRTWELLHLPVEGEKSPVRRLPDHRLLYLDYEGPVSGDRGHVIGWERGKAIWNRFEEPELEVLLFGNRLTAKLHLAPLNQRSNPTHELNPMEMQGQWVMTAEIWQIHDPAASASAE